MAKKMANPEAGEVAIEADGERYVLRMSTWAAKAIEAELGAGVGQIADSMQTNGARVSDLLVVFWGLLQEHHETVKLREAAAIIDAIGIGAAGQAITRCMELYFPDMPAEDEDKAPGKPG